MTILFIHWHLLYWIMTVMVSCKSHGICSAALITWHCTHCSPLPSVLSRPPLCQHQSIRISHYWTSNITSEYLITEHRTLPQNISKLNIEHYFRISNYWTLNITSEYLNTNNWTLLQNISILKIQNIRISEHWSLNNTSVYLNTEHWTLYFRILDTDLIIKHYCYFRRSELW